MYDNVEIVTPERVKINFETAGIGSRFVALLLDSLIQIGIFIAILLSLGSANITFSEILGDFFSWYTALLIIISSSILIGYFIFFEMIMKGRTPGKAAMKIRVIKSNGQPISFVSSLLRNIFRLVDMFPGLYGIGIIVMFISKESKRVGDYVGGTIVVKEYASKVPLTANDIVKGETKQVNIYPLSSQEYHLIKEFLSRRQQLVEAKRGELAQQLAIHFYEKFCIPVEQRRNHEAFLEKLMQMNASNN